MDELIRARMHEALEVEQPDSGLRARLLNSLPAEETPERRFGRDRQIPMGRRTEFAAGIAAVVLAAIVIGSFAYIRAVTRPQPVTPPIPGPSPTLTQPLIVDPTTPVILFNDLGNDLQVDGMTWDGRSGKVTHVPSGEQGSSSGEASNPAGTLFVHFPNILDRSGRVVARLSDGPYFDTRVIDFWGVWADDEYHYCQVVALPPAGTNPEPATLQLTTPGGSLRGVVRIGSQLSTATSVQVTVCSMLADRAVVIQREQSFIQYWVVQLSSGDVMWTHHFDNTCPPPLPTTVTACGIPNVVASRDGRYIAVVQPTGTSTIYGPNDSPVGVVHGLVRAFSWDGSLAVVASPASRASEERSSVIRWMDGAVIWTGPPGKYIWAFQPEPGGTSLAILTADPGYGYPSSPGTLYIVSSDGRVLAQRELGAGSLLVCRPVCGGAAW